MKKLTYNYVKEQIKKERYQLLSEEYINSWTKLKIRCDKWHEYEAKWNTFQQGIRCPYCSKNKITYDEIKEKIEKRRL